MAFFTISLAKRNRENIWETDEVKSYFQLKQAMRKFWVGQFDLKNVGFSFRRQGKQMYIFWGDGRGA